MSINFYFLVLSNKTEKLHKTVKTKMSSKNSGKLSFRSFLKRRFMNSNEGEPFDVKLISK